MGAPSEKIIQFADQILLHDLDIQIQFADRIPDIKIISQSANWIQFVWCFSFKIKEHLRTVYYFLFYSRVKRMPPLRFEGILRLKFSVKSRLYRTKTKPIKLCKAFVAAGIVTTIFVPKHVDTRETCSWPW